MIELIRREEERVVNLFCNICKANVAAFEQSAEGTDRCPTCRSVGRHRAVAFSLRQWKHYRPSLRALEIGGDGRFFKSDFEKLISVDCCAFGVDVVGDVEHLSFPAGCFDVILCLDVLEHVANDLAAVKEMARILRLGGGLFVTASCWGDEGETKTPQEAGLPAYHIGMSGRWDCLCYRYYSHASLVALIASGNLVCQPVSVSDSSMAIQDVRVIIATKGNER